jgi:hypothetical protein
VLRAVAAQHDDGPQGVPSGGDVRHSVAIRHLPLACSASHLLRSPCDCAPKPALPDFPSARRAGALQPSGGVGTRRRRVWWRGCGRGR